MRTEYKTLLILCVVSVFAVSCGVKAGPYLPKQILSKPAKNFQVFVRSEGVLLRWNAPRENTDSTPLLNLGGFRVFRAETEFEKICLSCPKEFSQIFDYHYMGTKNKAPKGQSFFIWTQLWSLKICIPTNFRYIMKTAMPVCPQGLWMFTGMSLL